jgi:ubiquinone/menaquinone biosynthesis C-methylase UbiE
MGQTGEGIVTRLFDEQKREIAVLSRLADFSGQRVLDVGCGDGRMTMLIAEIAGSVVGIDPNGDAIQQARKKVTDARCESVSLIAEDVNTVIATWLAAFDVVVFSRSL